MRQYLLLTAFLLAPFAAANASSFTTTSPNGPLPPVVSPVGGVVTDLVGLNGTRIVAEASAASEFIGYEQNYPNVNGVRYLTFATQTGITSSVLAALGGGISSAAFRISLYDGDSQAGNFDYNQDFLYVGAGGGSVGTTSTNSTGTNLGNFSAVTTQETDGMGNQISTNSGPGFGDSILDTGFFSTTNASTLSALYAQLLTASTGDQTLRFQLNDLTNGDQYFDFTQGIDASLLNTSSPPVVTSVTPEPNSFWLLASGGVGLIGVARRKLRRHA